MEHILAPDIICEWKHGKAILSQNSYREKYSPVSAVTEFPNLSGRAYYVGRDVDLVSRVGRVSRAGAGFNLGHIPDLYLVKHSSHRCAIKIKEANKDVFWHILASYQ